MPKVKKVLTESLFVYVKPVNRDWVKKTAKHSGMSYSEFLDGVIDALRKGRMPRKFYTWKQEQTKLAGPRVKGVKIGPRTPKQEPGKEVL